MNGFVVTRLAYSLIVEQDLIEQSFFQFLVRDSLV